MRNRKFARLFNDLLKKKPSREVKDIASQAGRLARFLAQNRKWAEEIRAGSEENKIIRAILDSWLAVLSLVSHVSERCPFSKYHSHFRYTLIYSKTAMKIKPHHRRIG
jgi:hypothetical protein